MPVFIWDNMFLTARLTCDYNYICFDLYTLKQVTGALWRISLGTYNLVSVNNLEEEKRDDVRHLSSVISAAIDLHRIPEVGLQTGHVTCHSSQSLTGVGSNNKLSAGSYDIQNTAHTEIIFVIQYVSDRL
jgi:hypothetical protein